MGGSNQSTCPVATPAKSRSKAVPVGNPIRSHEDTSRGEVDFHDDKAGFKCTVDSAAFFSAYTPWRSKMSEELTLAGQLVKTGKKKPSGHALVTFVPYMDDNGELQVSMSVKKAAMGQTGLDLDKLAHFS